MTSSASRPTQPNGRSPVFEIGFEQWIGEAEPKDFAGHIHAAAQAMRAIAGEAPVVAQAVAPKPTKPVRRAR